MRCSSPTSCSAASGVSGLIDVGDQRHVFAYGQAGDEVVKLEHEAYMLAPVTGEFALFGGRQIMIAPARFASGRRIQAT